MKCNFKGIHFTVKKNARRYKNKNHGFYLNCGLNVYISLSVRMIAIYSNYFAVIGILRQEIIIVINHVILNKILDETSLCYNMNLMK